MVDSNLVEKLFSFAKSPFEKGVEKKRKGLQGKTGNELTEIMRRETKIVEAGEGIRGAERLVKDAQMTREAARQKLEE